MKRAEKAFLITADGIAEIIGVEFVTPQGKPTYPCFKVRFQDGYEQHFPVDASDALRMISESGRAVS